MGKLASASAERKKDSAHSEMIRRLRVGNLRKLLRDRNGPILPDDDAGREYLMELLLAISVGPNAAIKMSNAIEVWAPWMDKKAAGAIIDQINLTPIYHRKPTAKVLGERLRVTNHERERLRLWTILPCDMGQKGMDWWRKHKDRERKRRRRQSCGLQTRAAYLAAHTTSKERPWLVFGIKRSTWYSQHRWTSPSEVKLTKAKDRPVQTEKRRVRKEVVAVERTPPTSCENLIQAEKAEMLLTDTAREINGHTCPNTSIDNWDGLLPDKGTLAIYLAQWARGA